MFPSTAFARLPRFLEKPTIHSLYSSQDNDFILYLLPQTLSTETPLQRSVAKPPVPPQQNRFGGQNRYPSPHLFPPKHWRLDREKKPLYPV